MLDLGCGSGALAHEIAKKGYEVVVGVDINECAIEQAKQAYKKDGGKLQFLVKDSTSTVAPK